MSSEIDEKEVIDIWYCESCSGAHLRSGETLLTFNREEFEAFTERAVDVNIRGWADHYAARPLRIRDNDTSVVEISSDNVLH